MVQKYKKYLKKFRALEQWEKQGVFNLEFFYNKFVLDYRKPSGRVTSFIWVIRYPIRGVSFSKEVNSIRKT